MRIISFLLGALCVVGGIGFALVGFITPFQYNRELASAIQITQVYAEADHYVLLAIAAFALATVFAVTSRDE